jgi:hypothetical protein
MKKIKLLSALFLLGSVLLISSCKKDDDPALTKTQLLTQNTWKYSSGTSSDPLGQLVLAFYSGAEYTYKTDKTYSYLIFTQPLSGKWEFSTDETKLITDKGTTEELTYDILKLDTSALEVKYTDSGITFTLKFVKK